jgi:hypothetical protein
LLDTPVAALKKLPPGKSPIPWKLAATAAEGQIHAKTRMSIFMRRNAIA